MFLLLFAVERMSGLQLSCPRLLVQHKDLQQKGTLIRGRVRLFIIHTLRLSGLAGTGCMSPITAFCSLHTSKGIPLWLLRILQPQIGPFFALISGLTSTSPPFSLTLPWQSPSTSRTGTKYINQFLFVFLNINLMRAKTNKAAWAE